MARNLIQKLLPADFSQEPEVAFKEDFNEGYPQDFFHGTFLGLGQNLKLAFFTDISQINLLSIH